MNINESNISHVLKNSEKYFIAKVETSNGPYVYKLAHKDNDRLIKEVSRINDLKSKNSFLNKKLAAVVENGVVKYGYHKGKCYYISEFIQGKTFSQLIQTVPSDMKVLRTGFQSIIGGLIDNLDSHSYEKRYDHSSGKFLTDYILESLHRLMELKLFRYLSSFDNLAIDGIQYEPLSKTIKSILEHPSIIALDKGTSFISELGHWNFHGDNILVTNVDKNDFSYEVIDPDVSIDSCDPLFGLARFLYTFPHDTCEYKQYYIKSSAFSPICEEAPSFEINMLWPEVVSNNYSNLFNPFLEESSYLEQSLKETLFSSNLHLRIKMNYLLCLLRGIFANSEPLFNTPTSKDDVFQNKGLFLYLECLKYSKELIGKLNG